MSSLLAFGAKNIYGQVSSAMNIEKPNFLFIITDDQTFESIGSLNNAEVQTPNLDRLVRQGTTFTHAFNQGSWSGAVSVASRCMLITGQHVNKAYKNDKYLDAWAQVKHEDPSTAVPLWGEVFKKAGYNTFMTGKWHNSEASLLQSFAGAKAVGEGFYESRDAQRNRLQYHRPDQNKNWTPYDPKNGGHWTPEVKDIVMKNGKPAISDKYVLHKHTSEAYGEEAINFLRQQHGNQPFFMYVAFNAPHDPRQSPKRFVEKYPQSALSLPANYQPVHPFDQGDSKVRDEQLAPFPRTPEAVRLHRQEYYAIISHADEVVGRIIDQLEYAGLDKNTYIIFTSDHGLAVGSHGLMGKQNLYDHTLRIPLIFKGPGIQQNVRAEGQVYMQGVYATTCELAGIPVPETVDFPSLLPMLKNPQVKGQEYIWGSYRHLQRMVRSERYKLIMYPQVKKIQLFDIQNDPYEKQNLAEKPALKKVLNKLFEVMKQKQVEFDDRLDLGSLDQYTI